ncbi:MAG TPA: thioredoxin domain-containing protein [Solirubrobacterales bacterium]
MNDSERRSRLLQMAAGAVFLALAVVLVLIVISSSSGGDGGDTKLEGAAAVDKLLAGAPQHEMTLGDPGAPVELIEFGDLQCPVCAAYSEEILPAIIENQVKKGEAKIDFRNFTIIGPESVTAGAAALAAGKQGRGWSFVDLFYRNQGGENSGYVDDAFLEAVAKGAGVKNLAKWNAERANLTSEVEATTQEAENLGFNGTPSFAVKGPKTNGIKLLGTPPSSGDLESAIADAG